MINILNYTLSIKGAFTLGQTLATWQHTNLSHAIGCSVAKRISMIACCQSLPTARFLPLADYLQLKARLHWGKQQQPGSMLTHRMLSGYPVSEKRNKPEYACYQFAHVNRHPQPMVPVAWLPASKIVRMKIRIAVLFDVYTWPNTSYLVACKLTGRWLSSCSVAKRRSMFACCGTAARVCLLPVCSRQQTICS